MVHRVFSWPLQNVVCGRAVLAMNSVPLRTMDSYIFAARSL